MQRRNTAGGLRRFLRSVRQMRAADDGVSQTGGVLLCRRVPGDDPRPDLVGHCPGQALRHVRRAPAFLLPRFARREKRAPAGGLRAGAAHRNLKS